MNYFRFYSYFLFYYYIFAFTMHLVAFAHAINM